jgi:hypothetical protein
LELQAIETEPTITVWFNRGPAKSTAPRPCQIERLDPQLMIVVIGDRQEGGSARDVKSVEIPLIFVRATWRTSTGWNVSIDGMAFEYVVNKREGYVPPGGFMV